MSAGARRTGIGVWDHRRDSDFRNFTSAGGWKILP